MDSSSTVELLGVTDTCSFLDMPFFYSKDVLGGGGDITNFVSYIIYRLNVQAMGGI